MINDTFRRLSPYALCTALMLGCGDSTTNEDQHIWKAQTDALDKAREIERVLLSGAQERREKMEQNQ